jgi:S1-C subfamily serine protease
MINFTSKNEDIVYKHERIVRIISHFKNGDVGVGTGFLVNGNILTCWHVICGTDLKVLRSNTDFSLSTKPTEAEKMNEYFNKITARIEVEFPNGTKVNTTLKEYDYYYDLAVLRIPKNCGKLSSFELETENSLDYSDEINYSGYPACLGYNLIDSPFAYSSGTISAFPNVEIAGGKYDMIQLSSICIGGNSGAPLFKKGINKVFGIVNGFEWRGFDNLAIFQNGNFSKTVNLHVPINISYATSFELLLKKSPVFKHLVEL